MKVSDRPISNNSSDTIRSGAAASMRTAQCWGCVTFVCVDAQVASVGCKENCCGRGVWCPSDA